MTEKKEKVGVQDIAQMLNISASTVSRALNDHPRISKETKDKVWKVARRLGYFNNQVVRPEVEQTEVILLVVPKLDFSFNREVIAGVRDFFSKLGYYVFVMDSLQGEEMIKSFFKEYKKYNISGIVHVLCNKNITAEYYNTLKKDLFPVVTVFEPDDSTAGVSAVLPDLFQGIFDSMKYLKSINAGKIALLLENKEKPEDSQLVSSFYSVCESLEIDQTPDIFYLNDEVEKVGYVLEALVRNGMPDVLFVKNVVIAVEVENEARRLGISIPGDVMLITIDTFTGTKRLAGNMSLLKLPAYEMGQKAADLLMYQIENPGADKKTSVVPVKFILKGSAMRIG
ncbi:MAG: LacI family transcriptional regulator [Chlorobi bacterium]|nr:LacI family transcriptional regulator [Chlorobiota bacterium]